MRHIAIPILVCLVFSCANSGRIKGPKKNLVLITTSMGDVKVRLYDETPKHRDNFLALVDKGYYDSLLFHRVIEQFMIQGGDPTSKGAPLWDMLGNGGPGYQIDSEIVPGLIHKKGALAAAREGDDVNPERKSSGSQFYIVTGRVHSNSRLDQLSKNIDHGRKVSCLQATLKQPEYEETMKWLQYYQGIRDGFRYDSIIRTFDPMLDEYIDSIGHHAFTEEQIKAYTSVGGAPHLDGAYTVFGEVVEGMEVIDAISRVQKNDFDRPLENVIILGMKRVKR